MVKEIHDQKVVSLNPGQDTLTNIGKYVDRAILHIFYAGKNRK